jgi:hypothetical protein
MGNRDVSCCRIGSGFGDFGVQRRNLPKLWLCLGGECLRDGKYLVYVPSFLRFGCNRPARFSSRQKWIEGRDLMVDAMDNNSIAV